MACLGLVLWPGFFIVWVVSRPLCDLFDCVISWLRVKCLDVNVCALTC